MVNLFYIEFTECFNSLDLHSSGQQVSRFRHIKFVSSGVTLSTASSRGEKKCRPISSPIYIKSYIFVAGIGKLKKKFFGGDIYLLYKLLLLSWASKTQRKLRDRSKNLNSEEDRGYYYSSDRIIKDYAYYGLCVFRRGHLVNFIALWSSKSQHTRESRKLGRKWIRDFNRTETNQTETVKRPNHAVIFTAFWPCGGNLLGRGS